MGNPNNEFLEKATVLGLAVPAGAMVGNMAANVAEHGYLSEKARDRAMAVQAIRDKAEEEARKKAPSGGDTPSTGRAKVMKKGGKVAGKLATRGYGKAR